MILLECREKTIPIRGNVSSVKGDFEKISASFKEELPIIES